MQETKPLECYALLIAKVTSLSSTYENYNQSEVDEAFLNWDCDSVTTDLTCPGGGGGQAGPALDCANSNSQFLCCRCQALGSSTNNWNANITNQEYGALLTRNIAG